MKFIPLFIYYIIWATQLFSQTYSGGKGTESDPFQISTLDDLKYLSENQADWKKCFVLANNIDAAKTKQWNNGSGFSPIGNYFSERFQGVFDGKGFEIRNLYIDRLSEDYIGFFGALSGSAKVMNIGFVDCEIYGRSKVGGFCAFTLSKRVENCFFNGSVTGTDMVGGFVANVWPGANISNCYFSGRVSIMGTGAGGFVFSNDAEIVNCYASAIMDTLKNSSGFCYSNDGKIWGTFWNKDIAKGKQVIGCIGISASQMSNQKMLENMGWNFDNIWTINNAIPVLRIMNSTIIQKFSGLGKGSATDPYQIKNIGQLQEISKDLNANYILVNNIDGSETGNWNAGYGFLPIGSKACGFKGILDGKGFTIKSVMINQGSCEYNDYLGSIAIFEKIDSNGIVLNLKIENLKLMPLASNYFSGLCIENYGHIEDCCLNDFIVSATVLDNFPEEHSGGFCKANHGTILNSSITGTGTDIMMGGFCGINYGKIDSCKSDVILTASSNSSGFCHLNKGFISNSSTNAQISHKPTTGIETGGFCGKNDGVIFSSFSKGKVSGDEKVGGFAGVNNGLIEFCNSYSEVLCSEEIGGGFCGIAFDSSIIRYCFSEGRIEGKNFIGGFIGRNNSKIHECYSQVETKGKYVTGGFVALNYDSIYNCYSTGNVFCSTYYAGGFCAANHWLLKNCFTSCSVESADNYSGFVYYNHENFLSVINCFYNRTKSNKICKYSTELTDENFKKGISFTSKGWDFEKIWCIEETITYPILQVFGNCNSTSVNEDYYVSDDIRIYPNPATQSISIIGCKGVITIFNSLGVEAWNGYIPENGVIDISGLAAGYYIIWIDDNVYMFIKY